MSHESKHDRLFSTHILQYFKNCYNLHSGLDTHVCQEEHANIPSGYLLLPGTGVEQYLLVIFIDFLTQLQWILHWRYPKTHNQKGSSDSQQEILRFVGSILLLQAHCDQIIDTLWIISTEYKRFSFLIFGSVLMFLTRMKCYVFPYL